jgi:hypothetical protein
MNDGQQPFGHVDRRERFAYGGLSARKELRPQEEMVWCREARQDRRVGVPVWTIARHRGAPLSGQRDIAQSW